MPALPKLPGLPVTKILVYFFAFVFALSAGLAVGTIVFKMQNPNAAINFGPFGTKPSPSPTPSPVVKKSPSPEPSPTGTVIPDDWLTYTNEILGFEFSYPPNATLEEGDLRGDAIEGSLISPAEFTYSVTLKINDSELFYIASSVNVSTEFLPVDPKASADALKAENDADPDAGIRMTVSEISLDGGKAYRVDSIDDERLVFFLLSKGKDDTSQISISTIAEKNSSQTVNQIIGSFKFLR